MDRLLLDLTSRAVLIWSKLMYNVGENLPAVVVYTIAVHFD